MTQTSNLTQIHQFQTFFPSCLSLKIIKHLKFKSIRINLCNFFYIYFSIKTYFFYFIYLLFFFFLVVVVVVEKPDHKPRALFKEKT